MWLQNGRRAIKVLPIKRVVGRMEKALLKRVCLCLCLCVCTYGESFNTGACSYTKVGVCKRSPPFKKESSKVVSCLRKVCKRFLTHHFPIFRLTFPVLNNMNNMSSL